MKKLLLVLWLALSAAAFAQTAADASLYRAFGETPGLTGLMDDFMARLLADPRTAPQFKDVNTQHVKEELVQQFCQLAGGPCVYKGVDMKTAHENLEIGKREFNALVELLQQAMDAKGIPFADQNRMLAKLAPMHRDVITVK